MIYLNKLSLGILIVSVLAGHTLSAQTINTLAYELRAESADRVIDEMSAYASLSGGYLSSMSTGNAVYKIPVKNGRDSIEKKLSSIPGVNVYRSTRSSQDVSATIVDRKARLKVAEVNLAKLRQLSGTAGLNDLMDLEKALNRSLEEVEELKGEIKYLEESSTLYTVSIRLNAISTTSDAKTVPIPWVRRLTLESIVKTGDNQ